jgi:hypothetical protein
VTRRQRGEPQSSKLDRLAIRHFTNPVLRAQPVSIQPRRRRRGQREFVPSDVVRVRVRNKTTRLTAAHIHGQLGDCQK